MRPALTRTHKKQHDFSVIVAGERLWTKKKALQVLGVSVSTLDRLVRRGDLPVVRLSTRAVRIPATALYALINARWDRRPSVEAAHERHP